MATENAPMRLIDHATAAAAAYAADLAEFERQWVEAIEIDAELFPS